MDIGKEEKTIIVEPLTTPVPPKEAPAAPERRPVKTPEPEKVPA